MTSSSSGMTRSDSTASMTFQPGRASVECVGDIEGGCFDENGDAKGAEGVDGRIGAPLGALFA
jgi:hypothetical protein